jgi:hypothetical protein
MNSQEWRGYEKLAAAVIADAIKNIRKRIVDIYSGRRPDADLRWIHDPNSNFEIWCFIAGFDPSVFRKRFPMQLGINFRVVDRQQHYKRKLKHANRKYKHKGRGKKNEGNL